MARTAEGRAAVATLSREAVLDEAMAIVAERGLAGLSMRVLAERCGVATMTIYGFTGTRDALVGAIGDRILGELALPDPGVPWDERLRELYRMLRDVLGIHPELAQIFATQHINGPAAYRAAEVAMVAFAEAGLSEDDAIAAFTAFSGFVIGFVLQDAAQRDAVVPDEQRATGLAEAGFPVGPAFLARTREEHFERGLQLLIDGVRA